MSQKQIISQQQPSQQLISIPTKICDGLFMSDQYIAQVFPCNILGYRMATNESSQPHNKLRRKTHKKQQSIKQYQFSYLLMVIKQYTKYPRSKCYRSFHQFYIISKKNIRLSSCALLTKRKQTLLYTSRLPDDKVILFHIKCYNYNNQIPMEFIQNIDIQLEPAFFEQLTSLHQKLQQKGLIKSRNWVINQNMSDQQIILTNTFLNSKKKPINQNNNIIKQSRTKSVNKNGNIKRVNFKQQLHIMHVYSPMTTISQLNPKRNNKSVEPRQSNSSVSNNLRNSRQKQRSESLNAKNTQSINRNQINCNNVLKQNNIINNSIINNNNSNKQNIQKDKEKQSLLSQINVTKKWAQLRESWMKQKQNNHNTLNSNKQNKQYNKQINKQFNKQNKQYNKQINKQFNKQNKQYNNQLINSNANIVNSNIQVIISYISENSRKSNSQQLKKQQKISDRIQQKLNLIKNGYQNKANDLLKRRDHTPITGKKISNTTNNNSKTQRQTFIKKDQLYNNNNQKSINQVYLNNLSIKSKQKQRQKQQINNVSSYDTNQDRINKNINNNSNLNNNQSNNQNNNQSNIINNNLNNNMGYNNNNIINTTSSTILKSSIKQLGNKSVIIVKPNSQFANSNNQNNNNNYNIQSNVSLSTQNRPSVNSISKVSEKQRQRQRQRQKQHTQSRNSLRKSSANYQQNTRQNTISNMSNNTSTNNNTRNYLINNQKQVLFSNSNTNKQATRYSLLHNSNNNKQNINYTNIINNTSTSTQKQTKSNYFLYKITQIDTKFFRNQKQQSISIDKIMNNNNNSLSNMGKIRSSSTKPIRKDDLANSSIMKNNSYSGKGKWKF